MDHIAFEHFDPEFELGNLDVNGKPIKPRKKPGRKPNPPSPAQRKAQNRAAQRAFRERKRREMRDAETNIKKCLNMRDQAIKEAKSLQLKVEELRYENNFLKGEVLTLKIACMANRVDVPKFWDTGMRDKMGSDTTTFSRTKEMPQRLEFFLNSQRYIITMLAEDLLPSSTPSSSPEILSFDHMSQQQQQQHHHQQQQQQQQQQQYQQQNQSHYHQQQHISSNISTTSTNTPYFNNQDVIDPLLSSPSSAATHDLPPLAGAFCFDDVSNAIQSLGHLDLDPTLMQYFLQPDTINEFVNQMKDVPPELWLSQVPPNMAALIPPEIRTYLSQPHQNSVLHNHVEKDSMDYTSSHYTSSSSPPSVSSSFKPEIPVEGDFWKDIKETSLSPSMANKVYVAGPISALDAVNQMRTMREQNDNRFLLTPTELQRKIPHDPRIDLVPGPTMRDFMIIFQDFYNANELFNTLLDSAVFIGGELGNPDCWFVPPNFIRKYWFLCPNHQPTRPDNSVELAVFFAQKMIDSLRRRKEMYIMRDRNLSYFIKPNMSQVCTDYDHNDDGETYRTKRVNSIDFFVLDNITKDVPRIISPNPFTL